MKEMTLLAKREYLEQVLEFVDTLLAEKNCTMRAQLELEIAVEELFVNIASYAYRPKEGPVTIQVSFEGNIVSIVFIDGGKPYNPWERDDPDITLSAEEREIGGLGIYLVKNTMNKVAYRYEDEKNILTIQKDITEEE